VEFDLVLSRTDAVGMVIKIYDLPQLARLASALLDKLFDRQAIATNAMM
jgi:hypothetical protein